MAARQSTKLQLAEAQATIAALREQLDAQIDPSPTATFFTFAQSVRDAMAVRALFAHSCDMYLALRQLGFEVKDKSFAQLRETAKQVFDTPGVHEMLAANLKDYEGQREALIARQVQIALHGTDENSTRAFGTLAKVLGWQKTPDSQYNDNRTVNVWQLPGLRSGVTHQREQTAIDAEVLDPLAALAYEPGEPARIDISEDIHAGGIDDE